MCHPSRNFLAAASPGQEISRMISLCLLYGWGYYYSKLNWANQLFWPGTRDLWSRISYYVELAVRDHVTNRQFNIIIEARLRASEHTV